MCAKQKSKKRVFAIKHHTVVELRHFLHHKKREREREKITRKQKLDMSGLFFPHPSPKKVLPLESLSETKVLHAFGEENHPPVSEMCCVLLLPKTLVLALDKHSPAGVFPGLSFNTGRMDSTTTVEILCSKAKADDFGASFFSHFSRVYLRQNVWEWDKLACRKGKRVNLRQILGCTNGEENPLVLVASDNLLAILGEDLETREKRFNNQFNKHDEDEDHSATHSAPTKEQALNPQIVVFPASNKSSYYPSPPLGGYNQKKSGGYVQQVLKDFVEVRMPGRVMPMLPFPIAVMEDVSEDLFWPKTDCRFEHFFLQDVFKANATHSFLVERIHWHKFIEVSMPLFAGEHVNPLVPRYYSEE